ncbi:MAG: ABC transporter substrate-binding protein [Desulfuromonadales bacterium]|nr:ABC transporter substrate-binding protein [Desulfuromonadales bacterium]
MTDEILIRIGKMTSLLFCALTLVLAVTTSGALCDEVKSAPTFPSKESLALGEKMYREGLLPSGKPMQANIKADSSVPGTTFTCVSCHLRSGLGSFEGDIYTTPTNGRSLYNPRGVPLPERGMATYKNGVKIEATPPRLPPARPAYTDVTLAEVLRTGKDPAGRVLDESIMPRIDLSEGDMAVLISYLKNLSTDFSQGVDGTFMRLATITSDDVTAADRAAMLTPMENFIENMNGLEKMYKENARKLRASFDKMPFRRLQLSHWTLKGPANTWQKQLEEYYRKEPVFALVGGIVTGDWKPIHDFSETNRIPCILPTTNFPVISETDWYTLYLSKGLYQEGESAASYVHGLKNTSVETNIVQIVRSSREGQALSSGFTKTWQELGHKSPRTIILKVGEPLTRDFLQTILTKERPTALMLWSGPDDLSLLEGIASSPHAPRAVVVSWGYLGKSIWSISEQAREIAYITYPYRMPQDETKYAVDIDRLKHLNNVKDAQLITLIKTYYALGVLSQAISNIKGNYYRDYLLDVISMQTDLESLLYERVSFGPDQRYVSRGCYITRIAKGNKQELIKMSDWITHN